ncbi:MAG: hypothetical protein ACYDCH_11715 [Gaiellaceae bacterium]
MISNTDRPRHWRRHDLRGALFAARVAASLPSCAGPSASSRSPLRCCSRAAAAARSPSRSTSRRSRLADNAKIFVGLRAIGRGLEALKRAKGNQSAARAAALSISEAPEIREAQRAATDLKKKGYNIGVIGTQALPHRVPSSAP